MKKFLIALAMAGAAAMAAPASATVYNFTSDVVNGNVFSGSFDISGPTGLRKLDAFTGSFMGFNYNLGDVGLYNSGSQINIGGNLSGTNQVSRNSNDFYIGFFIPSVTATAQGAVSTTTGILSTPRFTITEAATAVPEPANWALMTLGLGVVGFALRRRKSSGMNARLA